MIDYLQQTQRRTWIPRVMMVALIIVTAVGANGADSPDQREEDAVLAVVQQFFDVLASHDVTLGALLVMPEGRFHSTRESDNGQVIRSFDRDEFLESLAEGKKNYFERMWDPEVRIHGRLATVWTPYDFHRGKKFSHCGVDAFTLIKTGGVWQIVSCVYTVDMTGCEESPLGSP
ncbi:MAG: nuclear transport factor 2 family protein [bacterium]|nr:nuclear transport factor 2 family protein [bacterium]